MGYVLNPLNSKRLEVETEKQETKKRYLWMDEIVHTTLKLWLKPLFLGIYRENRLRNHLNGGAMSGFCHHPHGPSFRKGQSVASRGAAVDGVASYATEERGARPLETLAIVFSSTCLGFACFLYIYI